MERLIHVPVDSISLEGMLKVPEKPKGIILFSHGSGSGRLSPRNNFVAQILHKHHFATLLIDLLTQEEDEVYENRFDIDLLTRRLAVTAKWLATQSETQNLSLGLFGASTGAASALKLAAAMKQQVHAVVSRGGRPDLAGESLSQVTAPTLLIVGGNDEVVIHLNQMAFKKLKAKKELVIIPGASHLFEEPGTLEQVADQAAQWFSQYLSKS